MRQWLRSFVKWLDTRFPERVVVTQESYLRLESRVKTVEDIAARLAVAEDKLKKVDTEINKFNVSLGFSGGRGPAVPFQR